MYKKIRLSKNKTMDLHRYIMQNHLGRELLRTEEVHHIDGNKLNNDISNLKVMIKSEHASFHLANRVVKEETKQRLRDSSRKARPNAKLSIDQVKIIKHYLNAGLPNKEVCKITGQSKYCISQIKRNKRWSWVEV